MKDYESWQLWNRITIHKPIEWYLQEYYTGKIKKIPKELYNYISQLDTEAGELKSKLNEIENSLFKVVEKILKSKSKKMYQQQKEFYHYVSR